MNPVLILLMNTVAMLQLAGAHGPLTPAQLDIINGQVSNAVLLSRVAYLQENVPSWAVINPAVGMVRPTTTTEIVAAPRDFTAPAPMFNVFAQPKY